MYKLLGQSLSVKLFASLRQAINSDEIKIDIENGITVSQLKKIIFETCPRLKEGLMLKLQFSVAQLSLWSNSNIHT